MDDKMLMSEESKALEGVQKAIADLDDGAKQRVHQAATGIRNILNQDQSAGSLAVSITYMRASTQNNPRAAIGTGAAVASVLERLERDKRTKVQKMADDMRLIVNNSGRSGLEAITLIFNEVAAATANTSPKSSTRLNA